MVELSDWAEAGANATPVPPPVLVKHVLQVRFPVVALMLNGADAETANVPPVPEVSGRVRVWSLETFGILIVVSKTSAPEP